MITRGVMARRSARKEALFTALSGRIVHRDEAARGKKI